MCNGHSLHKKDWMMLAGGLGLAATGLGAAGMGPLAGLLGGSEAATGAGAAAANASLITPEAEASLGGIDAMQAAGQGGMGVAQNGIGSGTLSNQFAGLMNNPASALSSNGLPANMARGLLGGGAASGGAASGGKLAAMQMGMGLMQPQQPPPMPSPGRSAPASSEPLPTPYGPGGNSLGLMGQSGQLPISEEEKRRLRAMGVRI